MVIFKYILSLVLFIAGSAKVLSAKPIKEQFEEFGLPIPLMWGIGTLEILGAIGLQLENWSFYATVGLLLLMVGAVGNHVKVRHPISKVAPSFLLMLALAALLCLN